jgi:haloacetate dehalogenase
MLVNFWQQIIETNEAKINVVTGGTGFPVLLLHGYPQNHLMWHKIAPDLAKYFRVVATDLRGYGDSSKPKGDLDHYNYSKRTMGQDQIEVMSQLGYSQFYAIGHDRGARVAHRLALDYPEKVKKLVLLDILPTYELYKNSDREFASAYYHWFFLIQPAPFPETLIGANPEYFLRTCLQSWSRDFTAFAPEVLAEYIRCFSQPETIHATCEDYRAAASIDLVHDRLDLNEKIQCPVLVLWGNQGIIGLKYDVLSIWKQRAINVIGKGIDSGHFLVEENPNETYLKIRSFLRGAL